MIEIASHTLVEEWIAAAITAMLVVVVSALSWIFSEDKKTPEPLKPALVIVSKVSFIFYALLFVGGALQIDYERFFCPFITKALAMLTDLIILPAVLFVSTIGVMVFLTQIMDNFKTFMKYFRKIG